MPHFFAAPEQGSGEPVAQHRTEQQSHQNGQSNARQRRQGRAQQPQAAHEKAVHKEHRKGVLPKGCNQRQRLFWNDEQKQGDPGGAGGQQ